MFPSIAGFFVVSGHFTAYHDIPTKNWYFCRYLCIPTQQIPTTGARMALTDTFVKNVKPAGSATGEKHADGQGLYRHRPVQLRFR
ncbi:hypothetical protein DBR12_07635 [Acidovorax sp. HMWF029]|nr:hypothetical protein DBR12_07635 [Acidovorax sp. HMWF029]